MTTYGFNDYAPGINWSATERCFALRERDEETGSSTSNPLEPPQQFLMDIGSAEWGCVRFLPKFDLDTVPLGEERPETPDVIGEDGKPAYKNVVSLKLYSPNWGLRQMLATGAFITRVLLDLISTAEDRKKAQQGQIPVVAWVGDKPRKVTRGPGAGRTYYVPELQIIGFMERLPIFGERTVPIPTPAPALAGPLMQMSANPQDLVAIPGPKGSGKARIIGDGIPF